MTGRSIKRLTDKWRQDPEFVAAYDELEEEFSVAKALIEARSKAHMTQAELANEIGTDQANISRWEGGTAVPNVKTLQRIAKATGLRLVIAFQEPRQKGSRRQAAA